MKKRVKRQHGTSLHASGEDYLEAVLVLQKEKGMVRSVDVARHMGVSKPSVCHAVATLKEGGFLTMDGDFLDAAVRLFRYNLWTPTLRLGPHCGKTYPTTIFYCCEKEL